MITYVTSRWGEPTQTFVRREAAAVAAAGERVAALSLKRPGPAPGAIDARWLNPLEVAIGLFLAFARSPIRTVAILGALRLAHPRNMPALLMATMIGLSWSGHRLIQGHIHSHFGWVSAAAASAAARHAGVGYSVVYHAFEIHTAAKRDGFARLVARRSDQVFVIAERDVGIVKEYFGVEANVLRMGVPTEWVQPREHRSPDRLRLISVGSLTEKKGHEFAIRAVASMGGDWRLRIVGEGPLRTELEALVVSLNASRSIELVGLRAEEEVRAMLREADAFLLACVEAPSGDRDGIPVAIMEAMALGLPVVTTDAGSIDELVRGVGLSVPQRSVSSLVEAIRSLESEQLRHELAAGGQARIAASWTCEVNARQVVELL